MTTRPKRAAKQFRAAIDATRSAAERNRLGQFATPNALAIDIARYVDSLIDDRQARASASPIRRSVPAASSPRRSRCSAPSGSEAPSVSNSIRPSARPPATCGPTPGLRSCTATLLVSSPMALVRPRPTSSWPTRPTSATITSDREDKERLQRLARKMTGVEVNGLAGLYVYFLLLATAWMEDGGYAAWLIPSEFMDVNYGAALKRYLTDRVTLIRAHRFDPDDVQFGDALVSSVVLVFRKAPPPDGHAVEFTFGGTMNEPHASDRILRSNACASPASGPCTRATPGTTGTPSATATARHSLTSSASSAASPPASNKFFVLDRADAKRRELPEKYLRPILPSPRHLKTTVIEADDDGYPRIDRQLCVIDCDLPKASSRSASGPLGVPANRRSAGHHGRLSRRQAQPVVQAGAARAGPVPLHLHGPRLRREAALPLHLESLAM